jgi:hypothetical protein
MCTIEGPFFGGKVKELFSKSPLGLPTQELLMGMAGLSIVLDSSSAVLGKITGTYYNEADGWWYLCAELFEEAPNATGLAIDVYGKKMPDGTVGNIRVRHVCVVPDPWDEYARFTVGK